MATCISHVPHILSHKLTHAHTHSPPHMHTHAYTNVKSLQCVESYMDLIAEWTINLRTRQTFLSDFIHLKQLFIGPQPPRISVTPALLISLFLPPRSSAHFSHSLMQRTTFPWPLSEQHNIPGLILPTKCFSNVLFKTAKETQVCISTPSLCNRKMSDRKHLNRLTVGGQVTSYSNLFLF